MLVVTEIKIMDVNKSSIEIFSFDPLCVKARAFTVGAEPIEEDVIIKKEVIEGDEYVLPNGRRLVIGHSQTVRDALGIPITTFNILKTSNKKLLAESMKQQDEICRYQKLTLYYADLSFWGRLKLLWTGFKQEDL